MLNVLGKVSVETKACIVEDPVVEDSISTPQNPRHRLYFVFPGGPTTPEPTEFPVPSCN